MTDVVPLGRAARVAGAAVIAVTVVTYTGLALLAWLDPPPSPTGESAVAGAVWLLSWVPFGVVGGVLIAKRPGNPIGWQLSGIGVPILLVVLLDTATLGPAARGHTEGWVVAAAWLSSWLYAPTIPLLGLLIASFPSGRIRSRLLARLAPVAYATIGGIAFFRAVRPGPTDLLGIDNPVGLPVDRGIVDAGVTVATTIAVVYAVLAAGDMVRRYIRSTGVERRQLKWFVTSIAWFAVMFLTLVFAEEGFRRIFGKVGGEIVANLTFTLGLGGMATAIGIAVLRYRLYDIDRLVSRTVSYTALLLVLAGLYVGLVLGAQALVGGEETPDLVVALSTLLVAAAFGPVRRRVKRVVDRRFNRAGYDAARTVDAFGLWLRNHVDLREVSGRLNEVVADSLQPASVHLWLRDRGSDTT